MMKKRVMNIIGVLLIVTIISLLFYMEWQRRSEEKKEASVQKTSVIEELLARDLEKDYPKTPKEVIEYTSSITKALYSKAEDDEIKDLSKKLLGLLDEEFLAINPEEKYLVNLYSEIAAWNKVDRTITKYLFVNEEREAVETFEGRRYATIYVSYTIQQKGKVTEVRKYLLRTNEKNEWKILGWDVVPEDL